MMTIDTNVLVYLADDAEPQKQAVARALLDGLSTRPVSVGLQVIGEFQNALRRKLKQPPWTAAQLARNLMAVFPQFSYSSAAVEAALTQLAAGRLSYWDALLLAAAREAGCTAIFSEDLQDGATVLGVEIINPFGPDGLSPRAAQALAS